MWKDIKPYFLGYMIAAVNNCQNYAKYGNTSARACLKLTTYGQ